MADGLYMDRDPCGSFPCFHLQLDFCCLHGGWVLEARPSNKVAAQRSVERSAVAEELP